MPRTWVSLPEGLLAGSGVGSPSSPSYIDKKPLPRLDLPKSQLGNDDLTTQAMERFEAWLEAYHERRNRRWIEAYNENLHRRPPLPPVVPVHSPDP